MATGARRQIAGHPAWQVALGAVALAGTLATACMMPFVAVATMTAATMSRRRAATTIGAIWATNQLLGFMLLGYPWTGYAFVWGAALGAASIAAMLVASAVLATRERSVAMLLTAFAAAFVTYEAGLFAFALVAGGTGTFTPAIMAQILLNDALWFAGLGVLHTVLTLTAPRAFGSPLSLRLA